MTAVGDGVSRFAVGDCVVNAFIPTWIGGALREAAARYGLDADGWLVESRAVSELTLSTVRRQLTLLR